jgi:hypothetical protein
MVCWWDSTSIEDVISTTMVVDAVGRNGIHNVVRVYQWIG